MCHRVHIACSPFISEVTLSDPETGSTTFLNLVDLAGSEKIYKFETNANTIHESKNINQSLLNLEKVMIALEEQTKRKDPAYIPFRDSALTLFLKNCFQGSARISLIFTLNFSAQHTDQSVSTLRFALRCRKIKIQVSEAPNGNSSQNRSTTAALNNKIDFLNKWVQKAAENLQEFVWRFFEATEGKQEDGRV